MLAACCLATALAASVAAAPSHAQAVSGLEHLDSASRSGGTPDVIVLGEWHGTQQAPALVRRLALHYAGLGAHVSVVLEQADQLNDAYDIAGDGMIGRAALCNALADEMSWNRDGRTSVALAELAVDLSRAARTDGLPLVVRGMDLSEPIPEHIDVAPTTYRRDYNAANIARYAVQSDLTIVLVGNAHPPALKRRLVEDYGLDAVTMNMMWDAGEAWNCQMGVCEVHYSVGNALPAADGVRPPAVLPESDRRFDRRVYVGPISASPPALRIGWCDPRPQGPAVAR